MKIVIPNYFKLYFRFLTQDFHFSGYLAICFLPFLFIWAFKGKKGGISDLLESYYASFDTVFMPIFNLIKYFYDDISMLIFSIIVVLIVGVFHYMLLFLFVFLIIELFYFKYRIKGYKTQEIKKIFETKSAMKNLKKDMDLDRY